MLTGDTRPVAVGAYLFGGGFARGVAAAGFRVPLTLEPNAYGTVAATRNVAGLAALYPESAWPDGTSGATREPTLLFANPPCAVWSSLGASHIKSFDRELDARAECWGKVLDLVARYRPTSVAVETVARAWGTTHGQAALRAHARRLVGMGYSATLWFHDAQHLGMAQRRVRVMLLGTRVGDVVAHLPAPVAPRTVADVLLTDELLRNPGEPTDSEERRIAWRPLWEAAATRPRDFRTLHGELGGGRPIPGIYYRRLVADKPMGTYVAGDHCWHPTEPRPLGWRECLALCGYPLDWTVPNLGVKSASSLLARAVLPPVGEAVARALLAATRDGTGARTGLTIVDHRDPKAPDLRTELL